MTARDSRPQVPPPSRFARDAAAQSAPVGVVLLLAITVMGTGLVVGLGATALDDTRRAADLQRTEHALTLLDSRGAMTALGESGSQRVHLSGTGDGAYAVHDNSGWLRIRHLNHTGTGENETVYNATLGSVVYRNGDTRLAYEGGGVWRTTADGTVMVSPPEFHFRDATLVLPIIRIDGSGSASGSVYAAIDRGETARRVFPNATLAETHRTGAPYDHGGANYTNPIEEGTVEITIHSDHYRGWAKFFRTRTEGNVSVDHARRLARVELLTVSRVGAFPMPSEGNGVDVRGMPNEGTPVKTFTLNLKADNLGKDFENLHWSLYVDDGDERFEMHVYSPKKCKAGSLQEPLDVSVYYWNTSTGTYEGWQNQSIDTATSSDFSVDCDDYTLSMEFERAIGTAGSTPMEYGDINMTGNDNKWYFGSDIKSSRAASEVTFNGATYHRNQSDTAALSDVINRYFEFLGPDFTLTVSDGPGGSSRIDEGVSSGVLEYEGGGSRYITYLHITENEIRIRLN